MHEHGPEVYLSNAKGCSILPRVGSGRDLRICFSEFHTNNKIFDSTLLIPKSSINEYRRCFRSCFKLLVYRCNIIVRNIRQTLRFENRDRIGCVELLL